MEQEEEAAAASAPRFVVHDFLSLDSYGREDDQYYQPTTHAELKQLVALLKALPEGSIIPCRGRDYLPPVGPEGWGVRVSEDWEYGFLTLEDGYCRFLWKESGRSEQFPAADVDFRRLVHLVLERGEQLQRSYSSLRTSVHRVVVISHGFSPSLGPNYSIIRILENIALQEGWTPVVPNFLPSYKLGRERGRSERVKLIYEEILSLRERPHRIALVGHSQGGAASSLAATQRVIDAQNIVGLMLIGSESIVDGRDGAPPPIPHPKNEVLRILHAEEDEIVPFSSLLRLGRYWSVPVVSATSAVARGTKFFHDCVHHDFLAHELLIRLSRCFRAFLGDCGRSSEEKSYVVMSEPPSILDLHFNDGMLMVPSNAVPVGWIQVHGPLSSIVFAGVTPESLKRIDLNSGCTVITVYGDGVQRYTKVDESHPHVEEDARIHVEIVGSDLACSHFAALKQSVEVIVSWSFQRKD